MSIIVDNSFPVDSPELDKRVHFIPCRIADDGEANVQKYFEPCIKRDQNEALSASLRGYPLDGCEISLPEGHRALLLTESRQPLSEHSQRKFQVTSGFKKFVYWNYDQRPSANDAFVKALDWIDIAEAMHGD